MRLIIQRRRFHLSFALKLCLFISRTGSAVAVRLREQAIPINDCKMQSCSVLKAKGMMSKMEKTPSQRSGPTRTNTVKVQKA
jgi:hypothetical protein